MSDELKLWAYARSSSPRPGGLIRQMERLLADAGQNGWQIVGASQDMSTGKMLTRMGLREAQRAIRMKQAIHHRHKESIPPMLYSYISN